MHVLIASDGSDLALHAAQRGAAILRQPERITILSVVATIPAIETAGIDGVAYSAEAEQALWDAEMQKAHEEVERTAAAVDGAQIDKRAEVGDPATTICVVAEELGVDVIVIGSHGRKGVSRLFLGSTSEHVVRHAPCPVLVVRRAPAS